MTLLLLWFLLLVVVVHGRMVAVVLLVMLRLVGVGVVRMVVLKGTMAVLVVLSTVASQQNVSMVIIRTLIRLLLLLLLRGLLVLRTHLPMIHSGGPWKTWQTGRMKSIRSRQRDVAGVVGASVAQEETTRVWAPTSWGDTIAITVVIGIPAATFTLSSSIRTGTSVWGCRLCPKTGQDRRRRVHDHCCRKRRLLLLEQQGAHRAARRR
jgi:hypothetical protein